MQAFKKEMQFIVGSIEGYFVHSPVEYRNVHRSVGTRKVLLLNRITTPRKKTPLSAKVDNGIVYFRNSRFLIFQGDTTRTLLVIVKPHRTLVKSQGITNFVNFETELQEKNIILPVGNLHF